MRPLRSRGRLRLSNVTGCPRRLRASTALTSLGFAPVRALRVQRVGSAVSIWQLGLVAGRSRLNRSACQRQLACFETFHLSVPIGAS